MSTMPDAPDSLFIQFQAALVGRYSLERELGRGGMGVVYLAREVRLDRPVAIKLLPPGMARDGTLRERFLREARTAAKLSHPHIIPIFTVDEVGDFVFFAMAYVDGETLTERVRRRGPLPPSEAARVLREVAWALAYAHSQGLVHRDVKADNIMLETATGRALVADFGIAGLVRDAAALAGGEVIGTPEFMSPEQALGEPVDARSDLYALGVVGYFALSGALPFEGAQATEVLAKQATEPPPPLSSVVPGVPRRLARAVEQCLATHAAARAWAVGSGAHPAAGWGGRPRSRDSGVADDRVHRVAACRAVLGTGAPQCRELGGSGVRLGRPDHAATAARHRHRGVCQVLDRADRPLAIRPGAHVHLRQGAARADDASTHGALARDGGGAVVRDAAEGHAPAAPRPACRGAPAGRGRAENAAPARGAAAGPGRHRKRGRGTATGGCCGRGAAPADRRRPRGGARPRAATPQRRRAGARDNPPQPAAAARWLRHGAEPHDGPGPRARSGEADRLPPRGRAGGRRGAPLNCVALQSGARGRGTPSRPPGVLRARL